MSQTIQVITCWKCGKANPPKINSNGELINPEKCRNPNCRNLLDRNKVIEGIRKRMINLSPHPNYDFGLLNKKKPKPKKVYFFCPKCELFFDAQSGLDAHNKRRHACKDT